LFAVAEESPRLNLTVVVAEFPPYIKEKGLQGVFIEVLDEVAREAGVEFNYRVEPWARAQRMVQGESDFLIAPLTRTESREIFYQWVIPVLSDPYYLYQLADIKRLRVPEESTILVQRESPGLELLLKQGYNNLFEVNSERLGARMLINQRGNYWLAREMVAHYLIVEEASDQIPHLEAVLGFETEAMYLGAGANIDQATISRLQAAFDAIRQDGRYDSIVERYQPL
jgi:polar amino acid transport system substrate-binding protein